MKPSQSSSHTVVGKLNFISPEVGAPTINLSGNCRRCRHEVSRLRDLFSNMHRFLSACAERPSSLTATDRKRSPPRASKAVIVRNSSANTKNPAVLLGRDGDGRGLMQERDPNHKVGGNTTRHGVKDSGPDELRPYNEPIPTFTRDPPNHEMCVLNEKKIRSTERKGSGGWSRESASLCSTFLP